MCETPAGFALTGGYDSDLCAVFVASRKEWKRMPHMMRRRCRHGSVCIKGKLYVLCGTVSGSKSASVNCLTLENGQWVSLPDSPIKTACPKVAELNGFLYLLDADTMKLMKFDLEKKVWIILESIRVPSCYIPVSNVSMIAVNGQLCVAGGDNNICAWYHPATNTWSISKQNPRRNHVDGSLVQQDNTTLLLLGGNYGFLEGTDEVEEYNVADGSWSLSKFRMPTHLVGHTALYLDIPQE